MNIKQKQSQFELFPGSPGSSYEAEKPRYLFTHLTFTIDNLVMLTIVVLMSLILSFCLGVEKGKKVPMADSQGAGGQVALAAVTPDPAPAVSKAAAQEITVQEAVQEEILEVATESGPSMAAQNSLSGQYTVQVASFKLEKHAHMEANILKEKGYDIYVLPKGKYSIVCVGKFQDKDDALVFSRRLKNRYQDLLVRRL